MILLLRSSQWMTYCVPDLETSISWSSCVCVCVGAGGSHIILREGRSPTKKWIIRVFPSIPRVSLKRDCFLSSTWHAVNGEPFLCFPPSSFTSQRVFVQNADFSVPPAPPALPCTSPKISLLQRWSQSWLRKFFQQAPLTSSSVIL